MTERRAELNNHLTMANIAMCSAMNAIVLGMDRQTLLFNLKRLVEEAQKALDAVMGGA